VSSIGGLTSIVIPTYNHSSYLPEAIESALAQTAPVEVIVVDDGSTDDTARVVDEYDERHANLKVVHVDHAGPSAARNRGLLAARGEYVMFLDADDVIAPEKVAAQLAEFDDHVGWVLSDVRIEDAVRNRVELASERYRYKQRNLGGWIRDQLAISNFIPIMAPLVRRSVLADVRFGELLPEDWHFWYAVAAQARVRYVPQVLATYRKRRQGRNTTRHGIAHVSPQSEGGPLLLNLGCGTPGSPSWHPQPRCVNLDRAMGWCFEDGLPQYEAGSVAGITVSHALMYVDERDWPRVFAEFARVLQPGGVLRVTEDDTEDQRSSRLGGWRGSEPAVTQTSPARLWTALLEAGLAPHHVTADETRYVDASLCQAQHGKVPDVFFIEGVKPSGILFAPHHDDETLFAAFTLIRHRPRVVVCFPSAGDYGDTATRWAETVAAVRALGAVPHEGWMGDLSLGDQMRAIDRYEHPDVVWAPHPHASHPDHVAVAQMAETVFGDRVRWYHTYTEDGKVRQGQPVEHEPAWTRRKLEALACYRSQIGHPRANQFFMADLYEYEEPA
jgi:hypothetical protein